MEPEFENEINQLKEECDKFENCETEKSVIELINEGAPIITTRGYDYIRADFVRIIVNEKIKSMQAKINRLQEVICNEM